MLTLVEPEDEGQRSAASAEAAEEGRALALSFWAAAGAFPAGAAPREVARRACLALDTLQQGEPGGSRESGGALGPRALLARLAESPLGPYAAPEVVRGDGCDERALVFAVGVLVFERLTAHHPFGSTPDVRVSRLRRGELGSGVNYFPAVPGQLRTILLRAMGPFPEVRYEGLAALRADLWRFAESGAETSAASLPAVGAERARKPRPSATGTAPRAADDSLTPRRDPPTRATPAAAPPSPLRPESRGEAPSTARPPALPGPTPAPPGAVASTADRAVPASRRPLPRWLVPAISFLAGIALATSLLVLARPGGPPPAHEEVRAPRRAASAARSSPTHPAPRAPSSSPARVAVVAAAAPVHAPAAVPVSVAVEGEPEHVLAARRVLALVRRCGVTTVGERLRVAVYAQASGRVVRGFVRGDAVGLAEVACIRSRLRGLELGLRLPADDFVEWAVRLRSSAALDEVRLIRPRRWLRPS